MYRLKFLAVWSCVTIVIAYGSDAVGDAVNMLKHNPRVQTRSGWVLGRTNYTLELKKRYYVFQGIPYAKAPLGNLRFQEPQAAESWTGLKPAIKEGSVCTQPHQLDIIGSEDCLFINVYTPQLPNSQGSVKLPVMFWIHGGDFIARSGNMEVFGPDFLIEKDVVVVTINYRLGIFGFLSTEDEVVSGNIGLKDQVFALKWVRDNIDQFGGDPNKVTIFGQSAGGASVSYQLLSPLSKGLFVRAIAQSGSSLAKWAYTRNPRKIAFRTGEILNIEASNTRQLISELKKVDAKSLLKASFVSLLKNETFATQKLLMNDSFLANSLLINPLDGIPFTPTIEPSGPNAFISESPYEILNKGKFNNVPYMTGFVSSEGLITLRSHPSNEKLEPFSRTPELLVPWDLNVTRGSYESKEIARSIQDFYFQSNSIATLSQFVNYVSDVDFVKPIRQTVKLIGQYQSNVYLYQFSFEGDLGRAKLALQTRLEGTTHGDDNGYIWLALDHNRNPDPKAVLTRNRMVTMWTNFAKTGNPTPNSDEPLTPAKWPRAASPFDNNVKYLNIGERISVEANPRNEAMKFWENIYSTHKKGNYIIY